MLIILAFLVVATIATVIGLVPLFLKLKKNNDKITPVTNQTVQNNTGNKLKKE